MCSQFKYQLKYAFNREIRIVCVCVWVTMQLNVPIFSNLFKKKNICLLSNCNAFVSIENKFFSIFHIELWLQSKAIFWFISQRIATNPIFSNQKPSQIHSFLFQHNKCFSIESELCSTNDSNWKFWPLLHQNVE